MSASLTKLGLGAAQFGMDYGVSNARGRIPSPEAALMLERAAAAGVGVIDTAPAYGDADVILGQSLPRPCPFLVVTKVSTRDDVDAAEHQARASLANLGVDQAYAVLVHSAADLEGPHGLELWARLRRLQAKGLFRKIGISAYAGDDPVRLARRWKPDLMQLPVSLLDQRLVIEGALERLAEMDVEIHLRSIFLQGLLFLPPERLPPQLASAAPRLVQIRSQLALAGVHPLEAALKYALTRPEASAVIAGVTSLAELEALIAAATAPTPDLDWSDLRLDHPFALDPHRWSASPMRAA